MAQGTLNSQLGRASGWLSARPALAGAASLFVGAVLLASCSSSSPEPARQTPAPTSVGTGQPPAGSAAPSATTSAQPAAVPEPAHIVVIVMENHAYSQIIGSSSAPYINSLAKGYDVATNYTAITHPDDRDRDAECARPRFRNHA